jgi:putative ABC transport system permease protein
MLILNQDLLIRFTVSCLIAFPLAYYAVNRGLEDFAYKTPIHWWVFALGGFIVLAISLLTVSWETFKAARANPAETVKNSD